MKLWFVVCSAVFFGVAARAATTEELAAGKKLYTGKCARCHKLYEPTRYDDKAWDMWMTKMRDKARLNDDQYRQLSEYVATLRRPK
jgi:mono/diheme cytochrome c family protein